MLENQDQKPSNMWLTQRRDFLTDHKEKLETYKQENKTGITLL